MNDELEVLKCTESNIIDRIYAYENTICDIKNAWKKGVEECTLVKYDDSYDVLIRIITEEFISDLKKMLHMA